MEMIFGVILILISIGFVVSGIIGAINLHFIVKDIIAQRDDVCPKCDFLKDDCMCGLLFPVTSPVKDNN